MKEQQRADEIAAQHRRRILYQQFNRLVADRSVGDVVGILQAFLVDLLLSSDHSEESALRGVDAFAEDLRNAIAKRAAARRAAH